MLDIRLKQTLCVYSVYIFSNIQVVIEKGRFKFDIYIIQTNTLKIAPTASS